MPPAAASASSGSVAWLVPVDSVWLDVDWTSTGIPAAARAGRFLEHLSRRFFFWPHEGHKRRNPHRCVWAAGSGLSLASLGWAQLRQQMQSQTAGQAPSNSTSIAKRHVGEKSSPFPSSKLKTP